MQRWTDCHSSQPPCFIVARNMCALSLSVSLPDALSVDSEPLKTRLVSLVLMVQAWLGSLLLSLTYPPSLSFSSSLPLSPCLSITLCYFLPPQSLSQQLYISPTSASFSLLHSFNPSCLSFSSLSLPLKQLWLTSLTGGLQNTCSTSSIMVFTRSHIR